MLFCLILGEDTERTFSVIVDNNKKVTELRDLICEKNQKTFIDIDAKDLTLWRVDISLEDDEKMKLLNTKPPSEINIEQELGGKKMSRGKSVGFYFTQDPPDEYIHIIVQPRVTIRKCLPMFNVLPCKQGNSQLSHSFIRSGKRKHENSDEGQDRKRGE